MRCWLVLTDDGSVYDYITRIEEVGIKGLQEGGWNPAIPAPRGEEVREGDTCIVWRTGRGSGIVAIGKVGERVSLPPVPSNLLPRHGRSGIATGPPRQEVSVDLSRTMLASPLSRDILQASGLSQVADAVPPASESRRVRAALLDLSADQVQQLTELADNARAPDEWPTIWNITPGSVVERARLHKTYRGNARLRVGPSGGTPNFFCFVDRTQKPELAPAWDGHVLLAAGQTCARYANSPRQISISSENASLLSHLRRGLPLRVFELRGADCLYLGEFLIDQQRPVERIVSGRRRTTSLARLRLHKDSPVEDTETPIFRLRQLSGIELPSDPVTVFQTAPRVNLSLRPVNDQPTVTAVRDLLAALERDPSLATSLGDQDEAQLLASWVQRARHQADLDRLRAAIDEPTTPEETIRLLVTEMTWIFGGEFLPKAGRRDLALGTQLDLVLVRADGTLHGVELKTANINSLVTGEKNHRTVGSKINRATGQAMNYLRELDEMRPKIFSDQQLDSRRASMTVVIGHTGLVTNGTSPREVDETIRMYNSHHTRISVITYDRLVENAQRTLDLTAPG